MKNSTWLVLILLLAALNIFLFWPGHLYFLNDDFLHIPLTDQGHFFQTNSVRPLHELLVRIDLLLWGKRAYGYHITALLLHFIVCIQLYDLCSIIQLRWLHIERKQATQTSLLAVCIFLVYPQSSESIAWILGRAPVLSALFFMITVRLFFVNNYSWRIYLFGSLSFAAALFTYEQGVLLPIALILIVILEKEKVYRREKLTYSLVLLTVDLAYLIVRKLMTSELVGAYEGGNLITRNWGALAGNIARLFFRLVLNPGPGTTFVATSIFLVLLVCLIISATRKVGSNKKAIIFFTAIICLLIAPVVSLGVAVNSFESGRYLYLPSIFFVIAISIAGVAISNHTVQLRTQFILLLIVISGYWLWGKVTAANNYANASLYAATTENKVVQHFKTSADTLFIDTLRLSVNRLPVFRLGFKTGAKWLDENVDTNRIVVKNYYDEVQRR